MTDVDWVAQDDANRGLSMSICFIIGIFCVNTALLYNICRKNNKFFYNAKHQTLISLAIGDIFLALISLTLIAIYNHIYYIGCRTQMSGDIYRQFLLPFVYGIGLCTLALEVAIRQRATTSSSSSGNQRHDLAKAFIFSALPWFLGLVIILPLKMAGMDWDDNIICQNTSMTLSRERAIYWVSIILPAGLAFGSCLLVLFIKPTHQPTQPGVLGPTTTVSTNAPPPAYSDICDTYGDSTSSQQPSTMFTPGYNHYQYPQQNVGYQYPPQAPQNGPPQYHNAAYYPPSQPQAYQGDGFNTEPGHLAYSQPVNSATSFPDPSKEKIILLLAAIIFCFCLIPVAGFFLGYVLNDDVDVWDGVTVVYLFVGWLSTVRSLITLLLWLCSSTV